jgi:hypothetical protein
LPGTHTSIALPGGVCTRCSPVALHEPQQEVVNEGTPMTTIQRIGDHRRRRRWGGAGGTKNNANAIRPTATEISMVTVMRRSVVIDVGAKVDACSGSQSIRLAEVIHR